MAYLGLGLGAWRAALALDNKRVQLARQLDGLDQTRDLRRRKRDEVSRSKVLHGNVQGKGAAMDGIVQMSLLPVV